jgi:hypothetical protein
MSGAQRRLPRRPEETLVDERPFLLFGGDIFYASGGWHDLRGRFATLDDARAALTNPAVWEKETPPRYQEAFDPDSYQWYHIVDMRTGQVVEQSPRQAYGADGPA